MAMGKSNIPRQRMCTFNTVTLILDAWTVDCLSHVMEVCPALTIFSLDLTYFSTVSDNVSKHIRRRCCYGYQLLLKVFLLTTTSCIECFH